MPGWHIDNKSLYFALSDLLKLLSHDGMVSSVDKARPHDLNKGHKGGLSCFSEYGVPVLLRHD